MVKKKISQGWYKQEKELALNPPLLINNEVTIDALSEFVLAEKLVFQKLQKLYKLDSKWVNEYIGVDHVNNLTLLIQSTEYEIKRRRDSIKKIFVDEWSGVVGHIVDFIYGNDIMLFDLNGYLNIANTNTTFKKVMENRLVCIRQETHRVKPFPARVQNGQWICSPIPAIKKFKFTGLVSLSIRISTLLLLMEKGAQFPNLATLDIQPETFDKLIQEEGFLHRFISSCGILSGDTMNVKFDCPLGMHPKTMLEFLEGIGAVVPPEYYSKRRTEFEEPFKVNFDTKKRKNQEDGEHAKKKGK